MTHEEEILVFAVRYALGRMSYAVSDVCRYVSKNVKRLSINCLAVLIRDIEDEIEMYHRAGQKCGDECDEKDWVILLHILKEERHERL